MPQFLVRTLLWQQEQLLLPQQARPHQPRLLAPRFHAACPVSQAQRRAADRTSSQRSSRGSAGNGSSGQTQECVASSSRNVALLVFSYNSQAKPCFALQAVIALMEMGFDEKEVVDALRVNNNQQDAAVGVLVVKKKKQHILTTILTG